MGFFDAIDSVLNAIENGGLEKRLSQGIDRLEDVLDGTLKKGEQLADKSEKLAGSVDMLADKADRAIDRIQKKV